MTTVLADLDGPFADFDRHFFTRCAENGWAMDCTLDTQRHRFATDHIINRTDARHARAMVNTAGWFLELPVTAGSVDGLNRLAEHADVWICTKPLEANPTCRDDKAAWVARHLGDHWAHRLIIAPDKSFVNGTILLDDAPHPSWLNAGRATWEPVIFPMPWNGPGTAWDGLRRWTWGDPVEDLLASAPRP